MNIPHIFKLDNIYIIYFFTNLYDLLNYYFEIFIFCNSYYYSNVYYILTIHTLYTLVYYN